MENQYCYKYPRPSVTTDCVVFGLQQNKLTVLLIERGGDPYKGSWAFPGGFLDMDETAEKCAERELEEETGLKNIQLQQLHTFSAVDRDPRGRTISVVYTGIVNCNQYKIQGLDDAVDAKWFDINNLPSLAFDHAQVMQKAIANLKLKIQLIKSGIVEEDKLFSHIDFDHISEINITL